MDSDECVDFDNLTDNETNSVGINDCPFIEYEAVESDDSDTIQPSQQKRAKPQL